MLLQMANYKLSLEQIMLINQLDTLKELHLQVKEDRLWFRHQEAKLFKDKLLKNHPMVHKSNR
jgi:hypothetical protein